MFYISAKRVTYYKNKESKMINAVQNNGTNLNFTSLRAIKYRRAGVKEYKKMMSANEKVKDSLLEKFISKFFPNSALNYRMQGLKQLKRDTVTLNK